ncbi:transcriptional regulator (plasmid) [Haloferax mediterranei ATCC 33500]|uniref:Transcription regulator n=1 Tax=Haloferax mediterranei (strain ATCC 33500 / DSM 1411 / JCM 8866 / NBRC 14739 / NCIMB 2177 / R-4) TaxID=523841 RepID=I3RBF3_HALMT|nr:helix-turn-helix domain-containing protein [Haloferax mediterranei]AFK21563.1 transcription regulator [Haloferax mediterranei ATCC 33500]AHZ24389.1 transcriptional regulator [Haloferax mediterranei ATCC 33500]ELZ97128.1 transcriptional regulator [Haloferax mediterranei ATCC 33500]MDX5990129.1 helix-turn-helix domain-containing protein [Haloferax mediterranei ATCC 33500]QCQ76790.1 transcriptional regulator [Haloferax mediterranei ATCC 33500]
MSNGSESSSHSNATLPRTHERQDELTSMSSLFGRKWNPVIIHALVEDGPLGFSELREPIDRISNKALSESLSTLEERGVVERTTISQRPFRVEYSLTDWGESLGSIVMDFIDSTKRDTEGTDIVDNENKDVNTSTAIDLGK